jgi:mono/diheme cytochrome c family protein
MTMKRITRNVLVLALLASASLARADEAATAKLFKAQCATCHGLDGKGSTTAGKKVGTKDWSDPKVLKAMSDADVEQAIKTGKSEGGKGLMPSFAKLGDDKIKELVAYIRRFQR